ncbi:MAG: GTP-binding protein [Candidatus Heimdallarchaeota archaeon]|nr:GTP-binding protein [Candidatus Heimdallarchaeota archaeon]MDH5645295.1 GTP-binding protein [Candidatus Heimdallarchaeota archaeon]
MSRNSNYLLKIALLGDPATGKTSLRRRFMGKGFYSSHQLTLGADFANLDVKYGDYTVQYQIWDLAGQQRFENLRPRFYTGVMGALCVIDITRRETLVNLKQWIEELYRHNGRGVVPIVILGNKEDIRDDYSIPLEDLHNFVKALNKQAVNFNFEVFFLETSAKTGLNVKEAFETLAKQLLAKDGIYL